MSILLFRVDDRLVHGQVVIGWGRPLSAERVILIDDAVAESGWEQDLYRMAAPDGIEVDFATLAEADTALPAWANESIRTIVLTGDLATMTALQHAHPTLVASINLGGIHHQPGRTEKLRYLYLGPEEQASLSTLMDAGAKVTAQDLPTSPAVELKDLL
ncbi:MAG TPA: PTS sugar transporter subunit IIB [Gemmatimonadales bacterium]|nr:PTS sugar transporter subunit IIB [Gemmatimonadales bacterium]